MLNQSFTHLKTMAINDLKLIFSDATLRAFLVLPVLLFVMAIWLVPMLLTKYEFLNAYINLFLIVLIIENTQGFCIINSLLFIEEKETQVAKVYGILPVSKVRLVFARLFIPYVLTVFFNLALLNFQSLVDLSIIYSLIISLMAALIVPIYVLLLSSFAKNRLEGMVYIKLFNLLVLLPIAAFFIAGSWKHLLGVLPTHWLYQGIDSGLDASTSSEALLYALIYLVFSLVILRFSVKLFLKTQFR
jgi:fluoroquinolone transport system permease protein